MMHFSEEKKRLQRLKKEYRWLYASLTRIFVENDPMGLIRMGAPDDEYEMEVSRILSRLHEATSASTLGQIIHEEFAKAFKGAFDLMSEGSYPDYQRLFAQLGEVIWQEWMRWKEEQKEIKA